MIYLDFETRSQADLTRCGAWAYASHPSTQVLCAAWAVHDGPIRVWHCAHSSSFIDESPRPDELIHAIKAGHNIEAHYAGFERAIIINTWPRKYLWAIGLAKALEDPSRWRCSAAKGAAFALPRSLDGVAEALRLDERKDPGGKQLIHLLCKPDYVEDADALARLWAYCAQDIETERAVSKVLRDLHPDEQHLWEADCRMNERGITLDADFARAALYLVDNEKCALNTELYHLTGGAVEKGTQRERFVSWADGHGVELPNTRKETITELLSNGDLPSDVARGLSILRTVNMTSVAKFKAALEGESNGRLRNTQVFHGANTGRWSGKGIQPHNLPRGVSPAGCAIVANDVDLSLLDFQLLHGSPTETLSAAIRGLLIASEGMHLFVADYSAIEARVLCWLAGQEDALDLFRRGEDVYVDMAASVYGCSTSEVDSNKRFVGKQAVLGLGYGMGAVKFSDNVRDLGLRFGFGAAELPLEFFKSVVDVYRRKKYTAVVALWGALEEAATEVVRRKVTDRLNAVNVTINVGPVGFFMRGRFLHIELPSGRLLAYAEPALVKRCVWTFPAVNKLGEEVTLMVRTRQNSGCPVAAAKSRAVERNWVLRGEPSARNGVALTYMTARGQGAWIREETYGGKLAENVTQAVARDVLAGALLRADADRVFHRVLLTVHDELVCEADPNESLDAFRDLVAQQPKWAPDLPVSAEAWQGPRYGKV